MYFRAFAAVRAAAFWEIKRHEILKTRLFLCFLHTLTWISAFGANLIRPRKYWTLFGKARNHFYFRTVFLLSDLQIIFQKYLDHDKCLIFSKHIRAKALRPVHVLLSRFYPDFILILSWFYLNKIWIKQPLFFCQLYPDFIQILSRFFSKIRIKSG